MKRAILYQKDKKWVLETNQGQNTFTSKKSALIFAEVYKIKINEKS